jgi:hypothetical protein
MSSRKAIVNGVAALVLLVGTLMRGSLLGDVLRYSALAYMTAGLVVMARRGYLRRRPHWTGESWRRYLVTCAIPASALVLLVASLVAHAIRLPAIGAPGSATRGVFAGVTTLCLVVAAAGIAQAAWWLAEGDPSRQFRRASVAVPASRGVRRAFVRGPSFSRSAWWRWPAGVGRRRHGRDAPCGEGAARRAD